MDGGVSSRPADRLVRHLHPVTAAQLGAGADFGPASDTLTFTHLAWAEAAQLGTLAASETW
jgi:hypothetical protein